MPQESSEHFGSYFGRLVLEPLCDGRFMRVVEHFGFKDTDSKEWPVPIDARTDGASIPKALWSFMGGPFEGKYRYAAVVHDYYCSVHIAPWRAVHRMFYHAMRTSGVSIRGAKLMYAAVYFAGPRWSDMDIHNTRVATTLGQRIQQAIWVNDDLEDQNWEGFADDPLMAFLDLDVLAAIISAEDPAPEEIESALDEQTENINRNGYHLRLLNEGKLRASWEEVGDFR